MIEFFTEYGMFLAKAITIVVAVLATLGGVIALSARSGSIKPKAHIEIKNLNRHYDDMGHALESAMQSKKELKQTLKLRKKQHKAEAKAETAARRKVFVLNFHGDIRATAVSSLREEITAVLKVAKPQDEVMLRLESAGGMVHAYGLAASQLLRIKDKLTLTVAVDKVAASGGYMMACVADRIVAAPFAVLGSIGVIAQLPNFHRLLEKNDIDFEQFTAGEYKRTVTLFGENTDKARDKFRQEIEDTHELFKDFVGRYRADLDIAEVSTGEHWYGARALDLKLVDELRTSDDYLLAASENADLFEIIYTSKKPLLARLLGPASQVFGRPRTDWPLPEIM